MLTLLIPMLILLVFMLLTLYFASQSIISTTVRIIKQDIENKIVLELQDQVEPSAERYGVLVNEIKDYVRSFSSNKEFRSSLLSSLMWVFGVGMLLVIVQIVLLTIFFSHKVAGPVYRFEKVCHNMIEGNYTDTIRLRKGDEMQNLAKLLNEVIRINRERLLSFKSSKDDQEREKLTSTLQL